MTENSEMSEEAEVEMLRKLFAQLGAGSDQSLIMARQVIKRAAQVSEDRGVSRVEAMRYLIELVTKGRAGVSAEAFLGKVE